MSTELQNQNWGVTPPRKAQGFQLTLSTSRRVYDLRSLAWGEVAFQEGDTHQELFLTIHVESCDAYFRFQPTDTNDMNETTYIADNGTLSLQDAFAQRLPQNGFVDVRIDRNTDKYLAVKGSAAGTLRVHLSSQPNR